MISKSIKKYQIILAASILTLSILMPLRTIYAQNLDTLAIVRLENLLLISPDTLQFDMRVYRNSEAWSKWANGTFEIGVLDSVFKLSVQSASIEYVPGSSQLPVAPLTGQLPTDSYHIAASIVNDRISIGILGPEMFFNASTVPLDTGLLLGQFQLIGKDTTMLPLVLEWKRPQFYYQACAFKLEQDSIIDPNILWNNADDNIEMEDAAGKTTVRYEVDPAPDPYVKLKYFYAKYEGQRKVGLYWETESEFLNRGFILRRGILEWGSTDTASVVYKDFVASYEGGEGKAPETGMRGQGSSFRGKAYKYIYDTVPYRGETFCYSLYYKDFYGSEHYLATSCVKIPNSIITFAQANPNPMAFQSTIEYELDDDVLLECSVFDILGKRLKKLIELQEVKLGRHQVVFDAPREDFASQGVYEIIFLAHPVDDPGVEISKAVVKIQVIR